jgi:hypothetical protein
MTTGLHFFMAQEGKWWLSAVAPGAVASSSGGSKSCFKRKKMTEGCWVE